MEPFDSFRLDCKFSTEIMELFWEIEFISGLEIDGCLNFRCVSLDNSLDQSPRLIT